MLYVAIWYVSIRYDGEGRTVLLFTRCYVLLLFLSSYLEGLRAADGKVGKIKWCTNVSLFRSGIWLLRRDMINSGVREKLSFVVLWRYIQQHWSFVRRPTINIHTDFVWKFVYKSTCTVMVATVYDSLRLCSTDLTRDVQNLLKVIILHLRGLLTRNFC